MGPPLPALGRMGGRILPGLYLRASRAASSSSASRSSCVAASPVPSTCLWRLAAMALCAPLYAATELRHRRDAIDAPPTQARTGYEHYLRHESVDGADRWRNVRELANLAAPYAAGELVEFLDTLALVQDQDMAADDDEAKIPPKVRLMTVHASKGLEFQTVIIAGCEEGLLPHYYATADKDGEELAQAVDEERRLLYVAMTRAKESLALTRARTRLTWGVSRQMEASRFLDEIPADLRRDVRVAAPPSSRSHRRRWSSSKRRSDGMLAGF